MFIVYDVESGWSSEDMRFELLADAYAWVEARYEVDEDKSYMIRVEGGM